MSKKTPPTRKARILWHARWAAPLVIIGIITMSTGEESTTTESGLDIEAALTAPVESKEFIQEVVESGDVESSSNVEIRCEVDTPSQGLAIQEIVPEGTYVEEGDFLVRLDDTEMQSRLVTRQIDVNSSKATLAQNKADLEGAKLALEEYKSGTFREQEEQLESDEFVAKENLRRAEEYLRYSHRLAEKGYVSEVQLEADRFAVNKATKELEVTRTKLEVLRNFTREKMITQLEANIETGAARLSSAERAYQIDMEQLAEVEEQIEKCVIYAPTSGQVVYANKVSTSDEVLIEEGKAVRERQEIIRLPDPKRMQVIAEVNESRIDMIEAGMPVAISVDALPEEELTGELVKVTEYPLPRRNSYTAHIKNYGATIHINDPPAGLRPGMTAEVAILVDQREAAIQVPVQAVTERDGRFFCLVRNEEEGTVYAREITIGPANEQFVVIEKGLEEAETVVLRPDPYIDDFDLPAPLTGAQEMVAHQREGKSGSDNS